MGAPRAFRLPVAPWSQDPAEFDLGNHQPNPRAGRHPLGWPRWVHLRLSSGLRGFAPFRIYLALCCGPCGSLGIRGGRGAMPHVPVPADVPTGVGFIPTHGTHGPADNLICPGVPCQGSWLPREMASLGLSQCPAQPRGLAMVGGHLGAWSPHPAPSRHWVLGGWGGFGVRIWMELSAEAVGERMYGNPIAPAVPEPGKVHIVRNLPGFSSCRGFGFHTPKRLLEITGHSLRPRSCSAPE